MRVMTKKKGALSVCNPIEKSLLVKGRILAFLLLLLVLLRGRVIQRATPAAGGSRVAASSRTTSTLKQKKHCILSHKVQFNGSSAPACPTCLSQKDQDVILERIFETIGTTNKQSVEFGFGYGSADKMTMNDFYGGNSSKIITSGLNSHRLIQKGWNASFFDAEYENSIINLYKAVLSEENIGQAFRDANIPLDVDYVSIDVDSIDVWLLLGLLKSGYRPRVISVEFNSNWAAHMPVTCSKKWAPWTPGSRIYGTSAAAINIVAEMYGYKMTEIMKDLDVFLVRNDILQATCSNADSLPTFEWLGEGLLGVPVHRKCDKNVAAARLVDFPLALSGRNEEASKKAMDYIQELNTDWAKKGRKKPFCHL